MANGQFLVDENDPAVQQALQNQVERGPATNPAGGPPFVDDQFSAGAIVGIGLQPDLVGTQLPGRLPTFRLQPPPPSGSAAVGAAAQTTATIVKSSTSAASAPSTSTESMAVNEQTGSSYTVQTSDLGKLISMNSGSNPGTIYLPPIADGPIPAPSNSYSSSSQGPGTGSITQTLGTTINIGDVIFVLSSGYQTVGDAAPTASITDSVGNSFALLGATATFLGSGGSHSHSIQLFYAVSKYKITSGTSYTITADLAPSSDSYFGALCMFSMVGILNLVGSNYLSAGTANGSGNFSTGSITTNAGCLVFTIGGSQNTSSAQSPPSWLNVCGISGANGVTMDYLASFEGTVNPLWLTTALDSCAGETIALMTRYALGGLSALDAGFFTFVENTGSAPIELVSDDLIDGESDTFSVGANQGLLLVFNGTEWFTVRGISPAIFYQTIQQAGSSLPQEPDLNFLAPMKAVDNPTNGFGSTDVSVPNMVGDSGSGGTAGLVPAPPSGSAAAGDFLSASGTWSAPSLVSGVLKKTSNYNAASTDSGYLISFNSSSAATYTLLATPSSASWYVQVKNIGTGPVSIAPNGTDIDGVATTDLTLYEGDAVWIYTDGTNYFTGSPRPLSVGVFVSGSPTNGQVLLYLKMDRPCMFPASAPNSYGIANTAATGTATFTLKKNGTSFATVVWSASGTSGSWTQSSVESFAAGDILEIDAPSTADATLANVGITLQGYRF